MFVVDTMIESKQVSLPKQNDPKQSYSSPANLKYKSRGLITANYNVCRTIGKEKFAVFL